MWIAFIGPPGAGKGTLAAWLAGELGVPTLSTGEVLRAARHEESDAGRRIAVRLAAGELVPDALVTPIVANRLAQADCRHGCLLDGFPRTTPQAAELDRLLAALGAELDAAVLLEAAEEELLLRLASRGRDDDNAALVRRRLRDYQHITAPLADYYRVRGILLAIDAAGTPEEVRGRLRSALRLGRK